MLQPFREMTMMLPVPAGGKVTHFEPVHTGWADLTWLCMLTP
jgi:hypothetical protein